MNLVRYSIRDLERLTGIKAHTIRMWEKRYAVIHPQRTQTNIRYYTDSDLQKLLNISILNHNGLKISQIADLSEEEIVKEVSKISDIQGQVDADINKMIMAAIELHEEQFDRVLNSCLLKLGFEKTFCEIIFPLFEKLSVMWQIGRINACQERFITNLVRQKLLVATDGLSGSIDESKGLFLLFMPAGHENEIGLLFANYLLRKNKYQVVYLGPGVPYQHLSRMQNTDRYDSLLVSLNHAVEPRELQSYIQQLRVIFPNQSIHLTINKNQETIVAPEGVNLYSDYETVSDFLSE